jgi:hypothetical protein
LALYSEMVLELGTWKRPMGIKMEPMCRIPADMTNQGYHFLDGLWRNPYLFHYTLDWDWYLPYQGWSIHSHTRILLSFYFSWSFVASAFITFFLLLNSTITKEQELKSFLSISPWHDYEITPSTASSHDRLSPTPCQSHISQWIYFTY